MKQLDQRTNMRFGLIVALSLVLVGLLVSASAARNYTLIVYESEELDQLDPYHVNSTVGQRAYSLFCRPLLEYEFMRDLALDSFRGLLADRNIGVSKNQIRVVLKPDAYFYRKVEDPLTGKKTLDSLKVKSNDVITTWRNFSNKGSWLFPVSRWYQYQLDRYVKAVSAVDDSTLIFDLKRAKRTPELLLTFPIVPDEAVPVEKISAKPKEGSKQKEYMDHPWGSGPFVYEGQMKRSNTVTETFSRVGEIEDESFENIEIAVINRAAMEIKLNSAADDEICIPRIPLGLSHLPFVHYSKRRYPLPIIEQILFNNSKWPFKEHAVRAALSVYIERVNLGHQLGDELDMITGPIPYGYAKYCEDCDIPYYEYNVQLGDSLLQADGWVKSPDRGIWTKNGRELTVTITGFAGSDDNRVSETVNAIAKGWKLLGVDATSETLLRHEYFEKLEKGDFEAAFHVLEYRVVVDISRHYLKDGDENFSKFDDLELQQLWDSFSEVDGAEVIDLWHKIHERIGMQVPAAFLWSPHTEAAYSDWIDVGNNYYPHNFLGQVEKWKVEP